MSQQEALAWAFPDADTVDAQSFVLTDDQVHRVEELARAKLDSKLVRLFTATKDGAVQGYAFIDQHTVRTLPEAFLVVLAPDGSVRRLRVLAFYEPPEYRPPERWLHQFEGKTAEAPCACSATCTASPARRSPRRPSRAGCAAPSASTRSWSARAADAEPPGAR